jgi:hypothetical protein
MAIALLLVEIVEGAGRGYEQPRAGPLVAQADHTSSGAVTEGAVTEGAAAGADSAPAAAGGPASGSVPS